MREKKKKNIDVFNSSKNWEIMLVKMQATIIASRPGTKRDNIVQATSKWRARGGKRVDGTNAISEWYNGNTLVKPFLGNR